MQYQNKFQHKIRSLGHDKETIVVELVHLCLFSFIAEYELVQTRNAYK